MEGVIGLIYVGEDRYNNAFFTMKTGEAVIVQAGFGLTMLSNFPNDFEEFDGAELILKNGTVNLAEPYAYYNQPELIT